MLWGDFYEKFNKLGIILPKSKILKPTLLENPAENNLKKVFCIGNKAEILCHCRKICYS